MNAMSRIKKITRRALSSGSLTVVACLILIILGFNAAAQLLGEQKEPVAGYRVVAQYPHDTKAFTQGLVFMEGKLFEGTGKKGESTLRRIELTSGQIEQVVALDPTYFGEGIAGLDGKIYQLTWQNRVALVYEQRSFLPLATFRYSGEGWGLTHDGKQLILSDGTSTLRIIDPKTFEVTKRLKVRSQQGPVDKLNELEYCNGEILANIWYSEKIVRIAPETGEVLGWIDLTGLYPVRERSSRENVLNGIAYDESRQRLFVTGKNWPSVYEIELTPQRRAQ
ncbi:MAG: glutaminyl-peptide cyclotransferase [Planctomycetales bacterium]|nr:glutaminyl-peptide cyclotransferase [Planctomycetales bacterium]